jgi:hypothetical protein
MDFWQKLQSTLNQGLEASRELYGKAKEKAKDLGEKGMLSLEIRQLAGDLEKLTEKLGAKVYEVIANDEMAMVSRETAGIGEIVNEMKALEAKIAEREVQLKKL